MSRKIILAIAPTGGWGKGNNNPIGAERVAEEAVACAELGASVVHLHSRDQEGDLSKDQSEFLKTTKLIRDKSDIIIEASTGGLSDMTAEERALPAKCPQAGLASLNMGSLNFFDDVYCNSVPDIKLWLKLMRKAKVKPSLEIFDTSNITLTKHIIQEGLIKPRFNFNFIFNYKWGMEFSLSLLEVLKGMIPTPGIWGAIIGKNMDFSLHLQAALGGADIIRVGFEDSNICNNQQAKSNMELVETIRKELEILGFEIADVDEAKKILDIE